MSTFQLDIEQMSIEMFFQKISMLKNRSSDEKHQAFQEFLEKTPAVKYSSGEEHYENESFDIFCQTENWVVTEWIDGIKEQYRVLTDGFCNIYSVQKRKTSGCWLDFPNGEKIEASIPLDSLDEKFISFIEEFVSTNQLAFHSVDFYIKEFITSKQPAFHSADFYITDSSFGVFEYSNEYGTECLPLSEAVRIYPLFLRSVLKKTGHIFS